MVPAGFKKRVARLALLLLAWIWLTPAAMLAAEFGLHPDDQSALGERAPLILVHGINPDVSRAYSWQPFLDRALADPAFTSRFKAYLFVFEPAAPVRHNAHQLQEALHQFKENHPQAPGFRFVALSLGGLVVQGALQEDPGFWAQTERLVAVGVPFHGTPLANRAWIRARLRDMPFLSPMRRFNRLAYWVTEHRFPYFERDYCWDNFDGALPAGLAAQEPCPRELESSLTPARQDKLLLYAGFFGSDADERGWLSEVLRLPEPPKLGAMRKSLLGKHRMFRAVQPCLSSLPLNPALAAETILPLMAFNDGISPISSQLWLGRFVSRPDGGNPVSRQQLWQAVAALRGSDQARLFEGVDHRDWLEGETRHKGSDGRLFDWLHPQEARRDIFDWLLADLLERPAYISSQQGR